MPASHPSCWTSTAGWTPSSGCPPASTSWPLRLVDGVGAGAAAARRHATGHLRIDTVKFFADGGLSGATAALSVPYRHADTRGVLRMTTTSSWRSPARPTTPAGASRRMRSAMSPSTRCFGVYAALGAPRRSGIASSTSACPPTSSSRVRPGAASSPCRRPSSSHALGRNFRHYLPDALLPRAYPIRAMLDAGITVALSSDAPVVENDSPLAGIQAALTRRTRGPPDCPGPGHPVREALDAYTRAGPAPRRRQPRWARSSRAPGPISRCSRPIP